MSLRVIFARSLNGVIGIDNEMPWLLPEDLVRFRRLTLGHPVVMGRKTWESLPAAVRPMPGRENVVLTRQAGWSAPGATIAHSLEEVIALYPGRQLWVMGGAELYRQALPLADVVEETVVELECKGDTFAPEMDAGWTRVQHARHQSTCGLHYQWIRYVRTPIPPRNEAANDAGQVVSPAEFRNALLATARGAAAPEYAGKRVYASSKALRERQTCSNHMPGPFLDRGPWTAGTHKDDATKVFVESALYEHDVRLYVDGDFGSHEEKLKYAKSLAHFLNTAEDASL